MERCGAVVTRSHETCSEHKHQPWSRIHFPNKPYPTRVPFGCKKESL